MTKRTAGRREFLTAVAMTGAAATQPLAAFGQAVENARQDSSHDANPFPAHALPVDSPRRTPLPGPDRISVDQTNRGFIVSQGGLAGNRKG